MERSIRKILNQAHAPLCAAALLLLLSAHLALAQNKPPRGLKVPYPLGGSTSYFWVAHRAGFFENYGLKIQPIFIRGGREAVQALIAKDVPALMMAGRCISGDFLAHSSYRVTGNAVTLVEAAGKTAALAALSKRLPQEVPFTEVTRPGPG